MMTMSVPAVSLGVQTGVKKAENEKRVMSVRMPSLRQRASVRSHRKDARTAAAWQQYEQSGRIDTEFYLHSRQFTR